MVKKTIRRIIKYAALFIAFLLISQGLFYAHIYIEEKHNHPKVRKLINQDLTFEWDKMDDQLALVNDWIENKHLTNADKGRLYERASLIYMQKGEEMAYYRYLGYALYYLEHSDERDYSINIYLDLANFFYNNFDYNRADEMMDKALSISDFGDIENLQVKSYAFRLQAVLETAKGNFKEAEELLNKSYEALPEPDADVYVPSYIAINDIAMANIYVHTNRLDECEKILEEYKDSDYMTSDVFREIFLRDMIIPYYEIKCRLAFTRTWGSYNYRNEATVEEIAMVKSTVDEFMEICEENNYQKHELNTILELLNNAPVTQEAFLRDNYANITKLYTQLFDEQNRDYIDVINSQVEDSKLAIENVEQAHKKEVQEKEWVIVIIVIVFIIILTFVCIIINNRHDGLTMLYTRKVLNYDIYRSKRHPANHAVIMIDIDDFKHINDTYGHPEGDQILMFLGKLMMKEQSATVKPYRYGGEEFALLLTKESVKEAENIAERLRASMEHQVWSFDPTVSTTLSIGISRGENVEEILKEADESLYQSKENGKNRITVFKA